MGCQVKESKGAPPALVLESIAPAPAVISSPEPVVVYLAPASFASLGVYCLNEVEARYGDWSLQHDHLMIEVGHRLRQHEAWADGGCWR